MSHPLPGRNQPSGRPALPGLSEIYSAHASFVWRNLRRMGVQPSLMDDAVQDVFLVVHRRLDDFAARSEIKTWLFGIVLRVAQTYRRSFRRRWARMFDASSNQIEALSGPEPEGPMEIVARREETRLLHSLLEELADDKRAMLVSVELEQMTVPEAAESLGINLNTAYSRLRAARQAFEAAVARYKVRTTKKKRDLND